MIDRASQDLSLARPLDAPPPVADLLERFRARFAGRENAHGQWVKDAVKTPKVPAPPEAWERHLAGDGPILGSIPIRQDNCCLFGAIDWDHDQADHADLARRVAGQGLPLIVCRSKSGAAHLYLFLTAPTPARIVRRVLTDWAGRLGIDQTPSGTPAEIFPKQDVLEPTGIGNWINLPYYGGDATDRHAVDVDGARLGLAEFLDLADRRAVDPDALTAIAPRPGNASTAKAGTLDQAQRLLEQLAPARVDVYDDWCQVGMILRAVAGEHEDARALGAWDAWSRRSEKYQAGECERKWRSFEAAAREGDLTVATLARWAAEDAGDAIVADLNRQFAVVRTGGQVNVLVETTTAEGRAGIDLMSVPQWREWMRPRRAALGNREVQVADHWLASPKRLQYDGLAFSPEREVPGFYNLWRGLAVAPAPGDCSRFLAHLRDNVCRGDEAAYRWVEAWLAAVVQRPGAKVGTALVLRGKQGTGKTIVGRAIGRLLGDHYVLASDPRYITGRFNSHLANCLLLHADEGFWAGDKAAEGKLKDLVTGDYQLIEFKGKDSVRMRNHVRLLVTGNHDWLVPAGLEERRFAVLDVGEARMQDRAYFGALEAQLDQGGLAALLDHLLRVDLAATDLGRIPRTAALLEQKTASLSPELQWWIDVLHRGRLPGDTAGSGRALTRSLYDDYLEHARQVGISRRKIEMQISDFLERHAPGSRKERTRAGVTLVFPSLGACRRALEAALGQGVDWVGELDNWARYDGPNTEGV